MRLEGGTCASLDDMATTSAAGLIVRPKCEPSAATVPRRTGSRCIDAATGTKNSMIETAGAMPVPETTASAQGAIHLFHQLCEHRLQPTGHREQGNGGGQKHETHVHAPDNQDGHRDQVDEGDRDLHAHESGSPGCRGSSQAAWDGAIPALMISLTAIAPRGPGRTFPRPHYRR
jgi:hypothetical protein